MNIEPKAGDVWFADLGMVAKNRPVLVLAYPCAEDARALVVVAPLTSGHRRGRAVRIARLFPIDARRLCWR